VLTAAPAPIAAPGRSSLEVDATPSGAHVVLDGEAHALPFTIERPTGTGMKVLVERAGYQPQTVDLVFAEPTGRKHVELVPMSFSAKQTSRLVDAMSKKGVRRSDEAPRRKSLLVSPRGATK